MRTLAGFDVGGSKTHALICDLDGNVLGFGEAGGGNPEMVGYDGLTRTLNAALASALDRAGLRKEDLIYVGFGIAGYDWAGQQNDMLNAIGGIGIQAQISLANDADLGLWAGTSTGWGIVASAGTGNNVRGRTPDGRIGRITGNAVRYGEFGGASEMIFTALQRVAHMWTLRGPSTMLADLFIHETGAKHLEDLLEGLIENRYHLYAEHAPLIFQAASAGDAVANDVLRWSAGELAESVLAVARQLDLFEQQFEIVMAGSVFCHNLLYRDMFSEAVLEKLPEAVFQLLNTAPVPGAVLMAMEQMGMLTKEKRKNLLTQMDLIGVNHEETRRGPRN